MSLINLLVAAKTAIVRRQQRRRAYHELMALDDRSLADIGIHRTQIPAVVEGLEAAARRETMPVGAALALSPRQPNLVFDHRMLPRL